MHRAAILLSNYLVMEKSIVDMF